VALSLFALIGAGGLAFDYARLAGMHTELQQAADQAALAAATQLDGEAGATARAIAAAQGLLKNQARFANDGNGLIVYTGQADVTAGTQTAARVTFFSTLASAEANTGGYAGSTSVDSSAKFVRVEVGGREAVYALTPIVGALRSGIINAMATAGIGSAVCKVPPLMICNPKPGTPFDPAAMRGVGIQVTGHGNDRDGTNSTNTTWGPGDFGFLDVGTGQNSDLIKALAFQDLSLSCYQTGTGNVTTGNPQGLYDAVNTRFDIYDFSAGNGTALAPCSSGSCPAAENVIKDVFKKDTTTNGNGCKITTNDQGWHLLSGSEPSGPNFWPKAYDSADTVDTRLDTAITGMGLPRDNCHYLSYGRFCKAVNGTGGTSNESNKFGDGIWARKDYFDTYHSTARPANWKNITRYDTYRWELAATGRIPSNQPNTGNERQYGAPVCSIGTVRPGTDRRLLSVAMVENCGSLSGSSKTVVISNWIDVFLVEPTVDRGNGALKDSIYMEIVGRTSGTGNGVQTAQTVRRDVPYLVR
jgi:hypothetical protein